MDKSSRTMGARHIEEMLQKLPIGSERHQILSCAKQFKSSWVELGELLARVCQNQHFKQWGFSSFEQYCTKEVRIRRQTAEKLLLAFRFLERKEPELLHNRAERPIPDYRSIDLLREAEENKHLQDEDYRNLRNVIIEEGRSHPSAVKQYREMTLDQKTEQMPEFFYKSALIAAKRLATSLNHLDDVPKGIGTSIAELIDHLQTQVEQRQKT
ncbi:MAG: hypothetical protein JRE63_00745 [Deltaproteobacteria bacterium]|nr:hypothetical protein [Deltaproteobacteria bacterium]MBW2520624.1 hypothetical protein [Deltaproteobacteria bacterium]